MSSIGEHLKAIVNNPFQAFINPLKTFKTAEKNARGTEPTVQPAAVMPTTDDESVQAARRRRIAEMQARSGRASTIFTSGDEDKLGG